MQTRTAMLTPQAVRSECVQLACERAAAIVHRRMQRGLKSLAIITSIAPFFGLFGAVLGIISAFVGCGGEKSYCMAAVMDRLSNGLVPAALGLFVALQALWTYKYLNDQIETLDQEMKSASLSLGLRYTHDLAQRTLR